MIKWTGMIFLLACGFLPAHGQETAPPDTAITEALPRPPLKRMRPLQAAREDSMLRIDIRIGALDSILKNLPIPENIDINEGFLRLREDSLFRPRIHRVPKITERKEIVKFGEDVIVGRNEVILGNVTVVDGDVAVFGTVEGNVVVVKGDIRLASTSRVDGDMVCVWGSTDMDPGARAGSTNVFNFGKVFGKIFGSKLFPSLFLIIRLLRTVMLLAVAVLIGAAFPAPTRRVRTYLEKNYPKSLASGLITFLILPFMFVVLIITILGIPIALLFLPLAVISAFLLGITAFAHFAGEWLLKRLHCCQKIKAIPAIAVGILLFEIPSLLSKPLSLFGPIFSILVLLTGIAMFLFVWTPAFGAAVLTRFGKAPKIPLKQP